MVIYHISAYMTRDVGSHVCNHVRGRAYRCHGRNLRQPQTVAAAALRTAHDLKTEQKKRTLEKSKKRLKLYIKVDTLTKYTELLTIGGGGTRLCRSRSYAGSGGGLAAGLRYGALLS